jgi:hypothetical protein
VFNDDRQSAFGIPVDPEWLDVAREAWREIRLSIKYGPTELTAAWKARNELVLYVADKLREKGVARPIAVAWELVGDPDPKSFATKQQPGQPLGDLTANAVLEKFAPLIWSRLKRFRVAGDKDAQAGAKLGLLTALANYDPAVDVSVGIYAKAYRLIDDEIKKTIRDRAGEYPPQVSGDESLECDDGKTGERWETIAKAVLSDETANIIESAHDAQGRRRTNRIPFPTALWIVETNPPWKKPYVARRPWPMPPAPRRLPLHPPGPADFKHRRILEDVRQWPLLDGIAIGVHGGGSNSRWVTIHTTRRTKLHDRTVIEVLETPTLRRTEGYFFDSA